jgi:hypothetical protein
MRMLFLAVIKVYIQLEFESSSLLDHTFIINYNFAFITYGNNMLKMIFEYSYGSNINVLFSCVEIKSNYKM